MFQADLHQKLDEFPCTDDLISDALRENLELAILKTSAEVHGYTHTKKTGIGSIKITKKFRTY